MVFTEIKSWAKQSLGIKTDIRMFIRSTTSGDILFDRECDLYLDLSESSNSNDSTLETLLKLAVSVVKTAATDHIQAARVANSYIVNDIPRGKYSSFYQTDQQFYAKPQVVNETVKSDIHKTVTERKIRDGQSVISFFYNVMAEKTQKSSASVDESARRIQRLS